MSNVGHDADYLLARCEELETVISGYEDTINERDRENAALKAQLARAREWVNEFQSDQDVNSGDQGIICGYWDNLDNILSSAAAPLAVVEAQAFMVGDVFVQWVLDTEWREQIFNIAHPDRDLSGYSSIPVTVVVLPRDRSGRDENV